MPEGQGELGMPGGEGIGDILDEDQPLASVLVLSRIHIGPELIGCGPEGFLDIFDHPGSVVSIGTGGLCLTSHNQSRTRDGFCP